MNHVIRALSLCFAVVWASAAPASIKNELIRIGEAVLTKIALDPADFLFDIHLNAEDRTPLPIDKDGQVGMNVFPALIPFTEVNLSGKAKLHREHAGWPQIDINFGGWNSIAGMVASGMVEDFKGGLYGYHGGISAAVSADPRLRLFGGYEFSQMRVDVTVNFKDSSTSTGTGFDLQNSLSHLNVGKTEHFLFAGAEVLRSARKRLVAEVGYGVVSNKLMARLTWSSKNFDSGFVFFPESAWVLWPVWNFQVRF
ncbi:MAG: hypothetical protein AAB152_04985 [Candidatus Coatesbacteria bacterium]